jgi:hypothetical protein
MLVRGRAPVAHDQGQRLLLFLDPRGLRRRALTLPLSSDELLMYSDRLARGL